jgi:hypothetical protein
VASAKKTVEEFDPTGDEPIEPEADIADEDDELPEEVPATAEGKASAVRLLDLLLEKKALALHVAKPSASLIEAVARALEWPGPAGRKASMLSDAIVDSDDVDELFVDDDTLTEILKRW